MGGIWRRADSDISLGPYLKADKPTVCRVVRYERATYHRPYRPLGHQLALVPNGSLPVACWRTRTGAIAHSESIALVIRLALGVASGLRSVLP